MTEEEGHAWWDRTQGTGPQPRRRPTGLRGLLDDAERERDQLRAAMIAARDALDSADPARARAIIDKVLDPNVQHVQD